MLGYKNQATRIIELQKENEKLKETINRQQSDIDYLAMMTDVELGEDESIE